MGYYPSKICCLLNIFTNVGYSMVNCVIGGQILSMISGGKLSVIVGVVIVSLCSWSMAMFGMKVFSIYERCVYIILSNSLKHQLTITSVAWVPQLMVLCILLGSAAPRFDFNVHTDYSPKHLNAKRISFVALSLSIGLAWAPLAADYYVYYPPQIKRWKTFAVTLFGSLFAMLFTTIIGVGLGSILAGSPEFVAKYGDSPGGLIMTAYDPIGSFGKFCAVINVLALVANNTPGAYSMGMNFQMLGGVFQRVPRPVFTTVATVVYTACAMGGRNQLYEVFKGFLPLIGYWVIMWLVIILEEDLIFRRTKGYDWTQWNNRQYLPTGYAATLAFMIGWAGAVIGMVSIFHLTFIRLCSNNSAGSSILCWSYCRSRRGCGFGTVGGGWLHSDLLSSTENSRTVVHDPLKRTQLVLVTPGYVLGLVKISQSQQPRAAVFGL